MPERSVAAAAVLGVSLALGVAAAGHYVGSALHRARAAERTVTVRGFSEREVAANLAIWPLVYRVTGDDLAGVEQRLAESAQKITAFLRARFPDDEISFSAPPIPRPLMSTRTRIRSEPTSASVAGEQLLHAVL